MARFRSTFVGLDLEATDLSVDGGRIIEVAAVRFTDGREVAEFTSLVDPGLPIPPIITSITGIRDQDVTGKPSFEAIREQLAEFCGDAPIVGHNIQFDIGFLAANGLKLKNATYDTWKLATLLLPRAGSHSLESLAAELGLKHPEAHRALHDARVGAELFMYLTDKLAEVAPATASQLLTLVERHRYSLTQVFREVLGGATTTTKRKNSPTIKPAKGQAALPLHGTVELSSGWFGQLTHPNERAAAAGESLEVADLAALFEERLPKVVPGFELRAEQVALAQELVQALTTKAHLIIEAPAGVGRREAALIAASVRGRTTARTMYAVAGRKELARVRERAEQLTDLKLGRVEVLGQVREYISLHAVEQFVQRKKLTEVEVQLAVKLLLWLPTTTTGHLDELALTWEESLVAPAVTSENHKCDKTSEPDKCSYCAAFVRASNARVVLMTHKTLLEFLRTRQLKATDRLVLDDAQLLEDATTESLGIVFHQSALDRALDQASEEAPSDQKEIEKVRSHVTLVAGLVGVFVEGTSSAEDSWAGVRTVVLGAGHLGEPAFTRVQAGLRNLTGKLDTLATMLGARSLAARSIKGVQTSLLRAVEADPQHNVVQVQLNDRQQFVLRSQPIEVREFLATKLFGRTASVVVLGPRLTVERRFAYLRTRLGVPTTVREHVIASPHKLAERTAIISVSGHPEATSSAWVEATGRAIAQLSLTLRGRILVVFSSRSSVLGVQSIVEGLLAGSGTKLLAQGLSGGRGKAVQTLARHKNAVLLASYAFVDRIAFTHGFRAVVLVRLPFSVPSEPLTAARKARLASGFKELELPRVALKVRQEFDRVIEEPTDRGVFVVLDPKFQKEYASTFLRSLPEVPTHVVAASELAKVAAPYAAPHVEKPKRKR